MSQKYIDRNFLQHTFHSKQSRKESSREPSGVHSAVAMQSLAVILAKSTSLTHHAASSVCRSPEAISTRQLSPPRNLSFCTRGLLKCCPPFQRTQILTGNRDALQQSGWKPEIKEEQNTTHVHLMQLFCIISPTAKLTIANWSVTRRVPVKRNGNSNHHNEHCHAFTRKVPCITSIIGQTSKDIVDLCLTCPPPSNPRDFMPDPWHQQPLKQELSAGKICSGCVCFNSRMKFNVYPKTAVIACSY